MEPKTKEFNSVAAEAIGNSRVQQNLQGLYRGFHALSQQAARETDGWEQLRERARAIKAHTIDNLDHYLEMAADRVTASGGNVYFAADAEDARRHVVNLARSRNVKLVIKSKSMVSEEIGLNERLAEEGIEPVETDLGEYIIQLAEETPYHIIAPALHKSLSDVSELFQRKLRTPRYTEISDLTREARTQLREKFFRADMGITGANFIVAETGTVVLVTNEGNGRMCTSMPRIHVAITGMEKVVPSIEDMGVFLRLLIRSATGQLISSYVTTVDGPRKSDDEDGPDEFHLVIVDNGRSKLLADPELRESLYCIRCGACLNACPVYRKVGGHAYGWVYPGPIGAVISPMLTGLSDAKDLPNASSLCGACREACPIKIDIPRMLLYLRKELNEGQTYPEERNSSFLERLSMRLWRRTVVSPRIFKLAGRVASVLQWPLARRGRIGWLPFPLSRWTRYRSFPAVVSRPFRSRWSDLE